MKNNKKTLAFIAVAVMMMVAIAPVIMGSDDSDAAKPGSSVPDGVTKTYSPKKLAGLGLAGGIVVGGLSEYYFQWGWDTPEIPGANQEEINQAFRQSERDHAITLVDTINPIFGTMLTNDSTLWKFTSSYFERNTELSCSEWWTLDGDYNANEISVTSLLRTSAENYIYNWQQSMDDAYNKAFSQSAVWAADSAYSSITMGLSWNGAQLTTATPTETNHVFADFTQVVINPTSSNNYVFIDTSNVVTHGIYNNKTSGTIYILGADKAYVKEIESGIRYELNRGANLMSSVKNVDTGNTEPMPTGLYVLETSSAIYCGPMTHASTSDTADVRGGMIASNGTDYYCALSNGTTSKIYNSSGVGTNISSLSVFVNDSEETKHSYLFNNSGTDDLNVLSAYDSLIQSIHYVINKSAIAGDTVWRLYDVLEQSDNKLSPSSMTSLTYDGLTLTAEQSEAIYISALEQLANLYNDNEQELREAEIKVSSESLQLYCYGTLYLNGEVLYENAIFSPYMSTKEQSLTLGDNEWEGSGFIMIWGFEENYDDWDWSTALSDYLLVSVKTGDMVNVETMTYRGTDVESIDLTLTTIQKYTFDQNGMPTPVTVPKVLDASLLILVIIIELAVIIILIGMITNQSILFLIGGLVALAGILFRNQIAQALLTGDSWISCILMCAAVVGGGVVIYYLVREVI